MLTTNLGESIAAYDNFQNCYGIIGSGNRNFNKQFFLCTRQHTARFEFPLINEFELCGTSKVVERIAGLMTELADRNQPNSILVGEADVERLIATHPKKAL